MRSFIERFVSGDHSGREHALTGLVGEARARKLLQSEITIERVEAEYLEMMRTELGYRFAGMSPIYNPDRNEIHFSLAYGTNHPEGMDVMRRAEFKALSSHDQTQFKKTQKKTGPDLFDCLEETMEYRGPYLRARQEHRLTASKLVASLLDAETNGIEFIQLAAKVQEKKFLTRTEIGDVLMDMSREGTIKPSWMDRGGKRPVGGDVLCLA